MCYYLCKLKTSTILSNTDRELDISEKYLAVNTVTITKIIENVKKKSLMLLFKANSQVIAQLIYLQSTTDKGITFCDQSHIWLKLV